MKIKTLAAALVLFCGAPLGAGSALDMHVSPMVSMGPTTLRFLFTVERDPANRSLAVTVDSDHFVRGSEIPLEGDRAPRTIFLEYRGVPSGDYAIRSVLRGPGGTERAMAQVTATVIEPP